MTDEVGMKELLAQSPDAKAGTIIDGTVVSLSEKDLMIDIGLKQEAAINRAEFSHNLPKVGDKIPVLIIRMGGPEGRPVASWKLARERSSWNKITEAFEKKEILSGKIVKRVKGGVQVDIGLYAFMPASQIDERLVGNPDQWVGKDVRVLILEMDRSKGNVLVSRRKVVEAEKAVKRTETLEKLTPGQIVKGRVTNVTDFGVFIDIGGIEGLLHISDFSWTKVNDLKKEVKVNQEIEVKILKFDKASHKVSLGRKQLLPHPWDGIEKKYPIGSTIKGKVTGFASFGAFVEFESGIEGLIHVSEMSWTDKVRSPKTNLKEGEEVEVKVINLDRKKEKMSLSIKRLKENPWEKVAKKHPPGSHIEGTVTHLTTFGAFIRIASYPVEALLKTQDLSWTEKIQNPNKKLKVGDKVKAVVLDVDPEKEKMSLGVKQLTSDPLKILKIGHTVKGTVLKTTDFGVFVKLDNGLDGLIRNNELRNRRSIFSTSDADNRVASSKDQLPTFKDGEIINASVIKINKKDRKLDLSIRRYEKAQEKNLLNKYSTDSGRPTLGQALGWTDEESKA